MGLGGLVLFALSGLLWWWQVHPSIPRPALIAIESSVESPAAEPPLTEPPLATSSRELLQPQQLMRHIYALNFERFTESGRAQARRYLVETLTESGWTPQLQPFDTGVNIIATRPGTQAGKLILGAHYDTVANTVGADDNASGVAAVLEIARLLHPIPTPQTLEVVFFDQEEQGLLGSVHFLSDPSAHAEITGAVVLDMVGYRCTTPGCQQVPEGLAIRPPSDRGDFLVAIADAEHAQLLDPFQGTPDLKPPTLTINVPFKGLLTPLLARSDHTAFWFNDLGAVLLTDTAFLRNPHYHRPTDQPETLDPQFLTDTATQVAQGTLALLQASHPATTP